MARRSWIAGLGLRQVLLQEIESLFEMAIVAPAGQGQSQHPAGPDAVRLAGWKSAAGKPPQLFLCLLRLAISQQELGHLPDRGRVLRRRVERLPVLLFRLRPVADGFEALREGQGRVLHGNAGLRLRDGLHRPVPLARSGKELHDGYPGNRRVFGQLDRGPQLPFRVAP